MKDGNQVAKRRKHAFTPAERYAVMITHGQQCYLCRTPIDMSTFHVDHIIPEHLLDTPDRLTEVLELLGRPSDFNINSFANWLPACGPCNVRKRGLVFEPSGIAQANLQMAASKAVEAEKAATRVVGRQELAKALNTLQRWPKTEPLPDEIEDQLLPLLVDFAQHVSRSGLDAVIRVTPTYSVPLYELLKDDGATAVVRGPFGVGGGPSPERGIAAAMTCGVCGERFFNGTRCVLCGAQDDGD